MTVMQPSKGGNGLANAFLNNTATQAPQPMPQIQAPQSLLPMGPMPLPQSHGPFFGTLYPGPNAKPVVAAAAPEEKQPTGWNSAGLPVYGGR